MRILVTAFDPFGGDESNSSLMVLGKLPDTLDGVEIHKMVVPTVYGECTRVVLEKVKKTGADAVLCMGQAGGRRCITVEVIAVNYALSEMCDNNAKVLNGIKLAPKGENALFSNMPVKEMVEAVKNVGFEASLSASAGAFVCNSLLYGLLCALPQLKVGFVHLPYESGQGKEGFSMSSTDMGLCIEEMIKVINSERI